MDDKLINLIVTVIVIGIWAAQFFLKPKQQDTEQSFDEDEDANETAERPRHPYAEDPYTKVQEEIRRKIAERQAAQQPAPPTKELAPASRPLPAQRPSVAKEMQPVQRSPQPVPARPQAASIDEIHRRRERVAQGQARQGSVTIDRDLRPIPQAQLPERMFPTAQAHASAQKSVFPTAARSSQAAYQGSTKLRRVSNPRNLALKAALRSPGSTRQAILLREILDKPIGLRDPY